MHPKALLRCIPATLDQDEGLHLWLSCKGKAHIVQGGGTALAESFKKQCCSLKLV